MNHFAFRILRRFTLSVCFAISLPLFALAQEKAAEKKNTLTDLERAEAVKYFEETRQSFLDAINGLSESQWKYKAGPDRWSIADVAEHIAVSEETIFMMATRRSCRLPPRPKRKRQPKGKKNSFAPRSRIAVSKRRLLKCSNPPTAGPQRGIGQGLQFKP